MTPSVERQLVNGVWETHVVDESGGGGGGGGSQSLNVVRFPIAFDTPGIVSTTYAITAFDEPTPSITVAGNQTAAFAPGVAVVVTNDGVSNSGGSVVSSAFAAGETVVTVSGGVLFPEITPLTVTVAVGIPIYTPAIGDLLYGNATIPFILVTVSESWDGDSPILSVGNDETRQAQTALRTFDLVADNAIGYGLSQSGGNIDSSFTYLWRFETTDPLLAWVASGSGLDPGSTQGAAELVFLVIPAAS